MARLAKAVKAWRGLREGTRRFRAAAGRKPFYASARPRQPKPHKLKKAVTQARARQVEIKASQKSQRRAVLQARAKAFQQSQAARRVPSAGTQRFRSRTGKGPKYTSKKKAPAPPGMSRRRKVAYGVAAGGAIGGGIAAF